MTPRARPFSRRRALAAAGLFCLLPACGFAPVYGETSTARGVLDNIRLEDPRKREEYLFLREVETRLPATSNPRFFVKYRVQARTTGVPLRGVPRRQVSGDVSFEVIDTQTQKSLLTDEIETFTSFTDEGDLRLPQENDAIERVVKILADRFVARLAMRSQEILNASE